jgi:hypothetical protein
MKKIIISSLLLLFCLGIFGVRIYKSVLIKQNVTGHLKRAADANTIELAKQELAFAISYLEKNDLTSGYTSVLWKTPDEDIGFWYKNLIASKGELDNYKGNATLEKTNLLMKLRETLVDEGEKTDVTSPKGLSVFPHNKLWAFLIILALLIVFTTFTLLMIELDQKYKKPS